MHTEAGEEIECRVEWQLPCRVATLDLHPTRPLVALALVDGPMQVWDYNARSKLFEWSGQSEAEEEATEHLAQELLQKQADWKGPRDDTAAASAAALDKVKLSGARLVRFIDDDVRHWTSRRNTASAPASGSGVGASAASLSTSGVTGGSSAAMGSGGAEFKKESLSLNVGIGGGVQPPSSPRGGRGTGVEKQILYAGDAWAALVSYGGGRTRRFETEKGVTAVEWVARLGCLALGHVDGSVRLADPDNPGAAVDSTRVTRSHSRPVLRLFAYEAKGEPMLLSAAQDGFICVWALSAPLADERKDKERGTANPMRYKVHSSDGLATSGLLVSDEMLFTAGVDKQVCVWDVRNAKELLRARSLRTAALVACEPLSHPRFAPGSCLVAAAGEHKARIMVLEVRADDMGGKEKDKKKDDEALRVREIGNSSEWWVRPGKKKGPRVQGLWLHPFMSHLFFVTSKVGLVLVSLEPHRSPAFALPDGIQRPLSLLTLPDERLLSVVANARGVSAGLSIEKEGRKVRVYGAPSGRLLMLHALDTGKYQVHLGSTPYTLHEEGYAKSVAWGPGDGLLTLEMKAAATQEVVDPKKKKKDKKEESKAAIPMKIELRWRETPTSTSTDLSNILKSADKVHGGQLVGVESEHSDGTSVIQFYAWTTWLAVGTPLPAPLLLRWHAKEPLLLLAYRTHAMVMRLGPTSLSLLCHVPRTMSSAHWHHQALFYATPSTVELFFPARLPSPPIVLASFRPESPYACSAFVRRPLYGPVWPRPQGCVALVNVHDDALWLLESTEDRLSSVPLSSPALKTLMYIATRQVDKALASAAQVQACHHPALAQVFLSLDAPRDAMRLPFLTAYERLDMCRYGKLHDEAPDVVALCGGVKERKEGFGILPERSGSGSAIFDDDDARGTREGSAGATQLAAVALGLARAADLAGAYRKSLALYREALRLSSDALRPMIAFYVRNNKLKKLASLQKKQLLANKAEEACFSGVFLESDCFTAPLLVANPPLHYMTSPSTRPSSIKIQWGALPEVTLLPPEEDL